MSKFLMSSPLCLKLDSFHLKQFIYHISKAFFLYPVSRKNFWFFSFFVFVRILFISLQLSFLLMSTFLFISAFLCQETSQYALGHQGVIENKWSFTSFLIACETKKLIKTHCMQYAFFLLSLSFQAQNPILACWKV